MRVPLVWFTTLAWCVTLVALPSVLVAATLGALEVSLVALVAAYVVLGALATRVVAPKPIGARLSDAPHLTLCHPHGILTHGFVGLCVGYRTWSADRLATHGAPHFIAANITASADFFCRALSCRCSSPSRASIDSLMRQQKDIFLLPGGFNELVRHSYHFDVVDVGSRGAIRLALRHGYAVRVAFAFGERKTAYNLFEGPQQGPQGPQQGPHGLWNVRLWLAKRGVPAVVPLLLPWAPSPTVAFSPTLTFPLIADPTDADVERWHAAYVAALRDVHAAFKAPDDHLVVYDLRKRT
jgi:hypothetical protein